MIAIENHEDHYLLIPKRFCIEKCSQYFDTASIEVSSIVIDPSLLNLFMQQHICGRYDVNVYFPYRCRTIGCFGSLIAGLVEVYRIDFTNNIKFSYFLFLCTELYDGHGVLAPLKTQHITSSIFSALSQEREGTLSFQRSRYLYVLNL